MVKLKTFMKGASTGISCNHEIETWFESYSPWYSPQHFWLGWISQWNPMFFLIISIIPVYVHICPLQSSIFPWYSQQSFHIVLPLYSQSRVPLLFPVSSKYHHHYVSLKPVYSHSWFHCSSMFPWCVYYHSILQYMCPLLFQYIPIVFIIPVYYHCDSSIFSSCSQYRIYYTILYFHYIPVYIYIMKYTPIYAHHNPLTFHYSQNKFLFYSLCIPLYFHGSNIFQVYSHDASSEFPPDFPKSIPCKNMQTQQKGTRSRIDEELRPFGPRQWLQLASSGDPFALDDNMCSAGVGRERWFLWAFCGGWAELWKKSDVWWSGWWFGTFSIFPYIGNNHPNWLSYFSEGWPNTNQWWFYMRFIDSNGFPF